MESQDAPSREPRREELVRAAYELLAAEGFEGLRTRDVAARVGVNVATLHYHYPTKEALIRGVVGVAMSRFRTTLESDGPARRLLERHFAGLRRLAREEPQLFAVMGEVALRARRDAAISKILERSDEYWRTTIESLLKRAAKEGDVELRGTPGDIATLIVATLRGLFMVPTKAADARAVDRTIAQLEKMIGL